MKIRSRRPSAGSNEPVEQLSAVDFVLQGRRRRLFLVALTAYGGGLAEALFLVLATRVAFAITDGKETAGIIAGKSLSLDGALLIGLVLLLTRLSLAVWASWQTSNLTARVMADVRVRTAKAFLASSWEVQQLQRSGSLQQLLTNFSSSTGTIMTGVAGGVLAAANLVALVGLAVLVDPAGALALVVSVGCLGLLLRPLRNRIRKMGVESARIGMDFATGLSETSQLGLELHVFHVQDEAGRRISEHIEQTREVGVRAGFVGGIASPLYSGLAYLALLGALAVVSLTDSANLTSIGAVMLVMLRSLSYGQALQSTYNLVAGSSPQLEELQGQLASFERARRHDGGQPIGHVGAIEASSISFSYVEGQGVLHDVSFTIDEHEIVGIVGPSGGGKSTLVQLLLGLRDADDGSILVDGRDIRELSKAEWARRATFVPQAAHLIAGTIADNIRFLRSDVTDAQIEQAARLAHLHDDIAGFPEGYERQVGEQGGHLSGGQQQRLCIARALVESPDILILDEPTSALDVRSEHLVRTTLLGLKERMTVIVIAHRLSTLDICDRIMVIQDGELKGFDAPGRLEESNEFYREALALSGLR